jgi:hypothetical protein
MHDRQHELQTASAQFEAGLEELKSWNNIKDAED